MGRRWPARMRGAIMPCLIFWFLFASRQKERQQLSVRDHIFHIVKLYSTTKRALLKSGLFPEMMPSFPNLVRLQCTYLCCFIFFFQQGMDKRSTFLCPVGMNIRLVVTT